MEKIGKGRCPRKAYDLRTSLTNRICAKQAGANVWLVVPKDPGVFTGMVYKNDVPFVSLVQAYLDLKDHPRDQAKLRVQVPTIELESTVKCPDCGLENLP